MFQTSRVLFLPLMVTLALPMPAHAQAKWTRGQFSLRTFCGAVLVIASGFGVWRAEQNHRNHATGAWAKLNRSPTAAFADMGPDIPVVSDAWILPENTRTYAAYLANFGLDSEMRGNLTGLNALLARYPKLRRYSDKSPLQNQEQLLEYLGHKSAEWIVESNEEIGYPYGPYQFVYRWRASNLETLLNDLFEQMKSESLQETMAGRVEMRPIGPGDLALALENAKSIHRDFVKAKVSVDEYRGIEIDMPGYERGESGPFVVKRWRERDPHFEKAFARVLSNEYIQSIFALYSDIPHGPYAFHIKKAGTFATPAFLNLSVDDKEKILRHFLLFPETDGPVKIDGVPFDGEVTPLLTVLFNKLADVKREPSSLKEVMDAFLDKDLIAQTRVTPMYETVPKAKIALGLWPAHNPSWKIHYTNSEGTQLMIPDCYNRFVELREALLRYSQVRGILPQRLSDFEALKLDRQLLKDDSSLSAGAKLQMFEEAVQLQTVTNSPEVIKLAAEVQKEAAQALGMHKTFWTWLPPAGQDASAP